MPKTLIEELPRIAAEGRREAQQVLDRLSGGVQIGLQTNELVLPARDTSGLWRGQTGAEDHKQPTYNRLVLASVTVSYNPNLEELIRNMASYADDVDLLMLWDNSENHVDLSKLSQAFPGLILHQEHHNEGLPIAYNWAIQMARKNGCSHLMTMDQDSEFERFSAYRSWIERRIEIGITGVQINHEESSNEEETAIGTACQSGSVYPLAMLDRIGGFREDLFIGMVDAEMSLRAAENGYGIIQYNGSNLKHTIGSGRKVKFLGHSLKVSDYNDLRHYYDSRNRILLWHEFPYDYTVRGKMHHMIGRLKVIFKILLFENNKWAKVSAIIKGTFWGLCNRPVPYEE